MLHRTILGSLERFIGILIEHYTGDFPLWLAPQQAVILPITDDQQSFADDVMNRLIEFGFRCGIDKRSEKIGRKIRDSEKSKIPYMLIIGQREAENRQVSLRRRGQGDLGTISIVDLIDKMHNEVSENK